MITLCFILFGSADFNIQKLKLNFDNKFKYLISYNERDKSEYLKFIESDFIKDNKNIHVYLGNKVYWGHISIVDSMVTVINKAKEIFNTKYAFIIDGKSVLIRDYDYILNKLESDENINFFDWNQNWRTNYKIINKKDKFHHYSNNMTNLFYAFRDYDFSNVSGIKRLKKIIKLAKKNKKEYLKNLWKEKKYSEYFSIKRKDLKTFSKIFSIYFILLNDNFWINEYHGYDIKIFLGKESLNIEKKEILDKCYISSGFNISGNLNYLYDFVNSSIFKKNYEKLKNIWAPEESIFSVAYAEYNKNSENEKSYAAILRDFRVFFKSKKNEDMEKILFNESDPNDGYYFFYRQITNEKELNRVDNFLNRNKKRLK